MATFKDHFSTQASHYAESRPTYPAELFQYLATLCPERRHAWDCACGSGQATAGLAQHFDLVTATDASTAQIAQATPHPHVRYRVAPAEESGLESESVDLIVVAQALHWFDLERFYAEAHRVLRPKAVLAVWSYGIQQLANADLDREIQAFYHDVVGPYWPPERAVVEAGYRTIPFPFDELAPPTFTLRVNWDLPHLLGYFRSWSATARYIKANGADPVVDLERRLKPAWGDPRQPQSISWPLAMRVGRKRK